MHAAPHACKIGPCTTTCCRSPTCSRAASSSGRNNSSGGTAAATTREHLRAQPRQHARALQVLICKGITEPNAWSTGPKTYFRASARGCHSIRATLDLYYTPNRGVGRGAVSHTTVPRKVPFPFLPYRVSYATSSSVTSRRASSRCAGCSCGTGPETYSRLRPARERRRL